MPADKDKLIPLVQGLCTEQGASLHDDLVHALVMGKVLTALGEKSAPQVADAGFADSDVEGVRVFAYLWKGQPTDMFGKVGWDDIIERHIQSDALFADREWFFIADTDQTYMIEDEIACRPNGFEAFVDRIASLTLATLAAEQLGQHTPTAPSNVGRRPGL